MDLITEVLTRHINDPENYAVIVYAIKKAAEKEGLQAYVNGSTVHFRATPGQINTAGAHGESGREIVLERALEELRYEHSELF